MGPESSRVEGNEKEGVMGRIVVTEFVSLDGVMEDPVLTYEQV
jgi:hypothetical protein